MISNDLAGYVVNYSLENTIFTLSNSTYMPELHVIGQKCSLWGKSEKWLL